MHIRMASPMRRSGSSIFQFRKRIPASLNGKAQGTALAIPVGDTIHQMVITANATHVIFPLQTRDPREAKERKAVATAYLDAVWKALLEGPKRLTQKQTHALAGEAYRDLVSTFEDDPGSAEIWETILSLHSKAMAGGDATREKWFGPSLDQTLARHRLVIDAASRTALLDAFGKAASLASERVGRYAVGDYRPDDVAERFPAMEPPKLVPAQRPASAETQTISGLVEGWWREAKPAGRSISTHEAYSRAASQLIAFLGRDDARSVTPEDIIAFKDYRVSQGISLKTISAGDISGIRQLFAWGVANRRVSHNPAKEIKVPKTKRKRTRDPGFSDEEAIAILSDALAHRPTGKKSQHLSNARRWVPWLCAYSGARLGEMVQLRKQDLRKEAGLWIMRISPEAVTVKDGDYRDVPLHPHLVEQGFPEFVSKAADGYLFMKVMADTPTAERGAWRTTKNRVREFVREIISDPNVQPNHAWRHRFMTIGRNLGIARDVRFSITGHETEAEGDQYGLASNEAKAAALARYPRYSVVGS